MPIFGVGGGGGGTGGAVVGSAIQEVSTATGSGTATSQFAAMDHVHRGLRAFDVQGIASTYYGDFQFSAGNNITLSTAGNTTAGTVVIHGGAGAAGFVGGVSTGGNTAGDTTAVTGRLILAGGNNITLSGSSNLGSYTVTVSGPNSTAYAVSNALQDVSTATGSGTGVTQFAAHDHVHRGMRAYDIAGIASTFFGNVQYSGGALMALSTGGNTTAGTVAFHNLLSTGTVAQPVASAALVGANVSRFANEGHQHAGVFSIGISTLGNTAGTTAILPAQYIFAGGNNITLSQSSAIGNLVTLTISGPNSTAYAVSNAIQDVSTATGSGTGVTQFAAHDHVHRGLRAYDVQGIASTFFGNFQVSAGANITLSTAGNSTAGTIAIHGGAGGAGYTAGVSTGGNTAGDTTAVTGRLILAGGNNITLSGSSNAGSMTITISAGAGGAGLSAGFSTMGNTLGDTGAVTGRLIFVGSQNITMSGSTNAGSMTVTVSGPTGGGAGMSNLGNTAGTSGTVGARLVFVGSQGISLSQSTANTGSGTLTIYGAPFISSYENVLFVSNITQSVAPGSVSQAVAFMLPANGSFSFLRIPIALSTNSTTLSTAAASLSGSCSVVTTWNAVLYSMNTGANSRSLQWVTSGSGGATMLNSISVGADGTSGSYTQSLAMQVEGGGTTRTTQYTVANTNYSFTTNQIFTAFSGSRFLDIPLAASLPAGPYWLIFGMSTNSASNSARISAATNCAIGYSRHYAVSQGNINFMIMGSTDATSGGLLGAGSFSTAGGGTTANLPMSAISSSASNLRPYFQLLRSA